MSDMDEEAEERSASMEEELGVEEVVRAPSLYTRPAFFRQTRKRGKIIKTVSEQYLRDDLGFGCHYVDQDTTNRRVKEAVVGKPRVIETTEELLSLLKPCKPSSLVVCDTNVLLHNLDVLEQAEVAMPNLVIPQTALTECRANRMVAYDRTVDLLRSVGSGDQKNARCCIFFPDPHHVGTANVENSQQTANDENDERIRNVAEYFGEHLRGSNIRVILLTDDAGSRELAQPNSDLYQAKSVRSWVQELEKHNPGLSLSDLVAQYGSSGSAIAKGESPDEDHFLPHVDATTLSRGVQNGTYHRSVLRSTGKEEAQVTIRRGEERVAVAIQGSIDRNRAVDGDVVAIAINPLDEWIPAIGETAVGAKNKSKSNGAGIASDTAEPTESEMNNVPEVFAGEDAAKSLRPTGKVVGILRRNFSNQSGSIYETKTGLESSELTEREQIAAKYEREHPDGSTTCVFFPVDKKIPPILIRTTQRDRLLSQRIVVSMDAWPANSPYPLGHYVRTIGLAGSKDVETEVLLQQHNIPHEPFPPAVLACLPPADYSIDADKSPGRLDLRHLPILSIDPPNCKDIDDALHCIVLPNGNYQVGVSIVQVDLLHILSTSLLLTDNI
jgi:exosome complex exonuclease DIS3/RRP44